MPRHPLTNSGIQRYYQNEHEFNGFYLRKNLLKIKDGAYVINPDEFKSIGTHWIALYLNNDNIIYFDSFQFEHIPKEIYKFIENYFKHVLILASTITRCILISAFAYLIDISMGIRNFEIVLKICAITARIRKYKSIIKKKKLNSIN